MFSKIVAVIKSGFWPIYVMLDFKKLESYFLISSPYNFKLPEEIFNELFRSFKKVLFPEPVRPIIPIVSPGFIFNDISLKLLVVKYEKFTLDISKI